MVYARSECKQQVLPALLPATRPRETPTLPPPPNSGYNFKSSSPVDYSVNERATRGRVVALHPFSQVTPIEIVRLASSHPAFLLFHMGQGLRPSRSKRRASSLCVHWHDDLERCLVQPRIPEQHLLLFVN